MTDVFAKTRQVSAQVIPAGHSRLSGIFLQIRTRARMTDMDKPQRKRWKTKGSLSTCCTSDLKPPVVKKNMDLFFQENDDLLQGHQFTLIAPKI
jgi:hypothetical protein